MIGIYAWPIKGWSDFQSEANNSTQLLLPGQPVISKVREPSEFIAATKADLTIDSTRRMFCFLECLEKSARHLTPYIQEMFRTVFVLPLSRGINDLTIAKGISEEWDAVLSTMNPQRVANLSQVSRSLVLKELKASFCNEDFDFEDFVEDGQSWQNLLLEWADCNFGIVIVCY